MSAAAGGVPVFGVFGDQSVDEILRISRAAGLSGRPASRDLSPRGRGAASRRRAARLARGAHRRPRRPRTSCARRGRDADAVLVEPRVAHAAGRQPASRSTWRVAREARARLAGGAMVLAGGLTPETVAAAVALVRPDIVDVSSGVERLPGIKDPDKIARFLEAVVWP